MAKPKKKFNTENETPSNVHSLGKTKKLTVHDLCAFQPLTDGQANFTALFYQQTPLILQNGFAGTGKTFCAMYVAFSAALSAQFNYDKVIIIRSAVSVRDQGALPGDQEEKDAPFEEPYIDNCKKIFPKYNDPYKHLKACKQLEFRTTANMRGLTFDNAIVIIDECQNMDYSELATCISRCGVNTRYIICGDERQTDLQRNREISGMSKLQEVLRQMPYDMFDYVTYGADDIVRSDLLKAFIIAENQTTF